MQEIEFFLWFLGTGKNMEVLDQYIVLLEMFFQSIQYLWIQLFQLE